MENGIRFKQVVISENGNSTKIIGLDDKGVLWEYISLTMYEDKYHRRSGWRRFNDYKLKER